jgi:hypothetical protein
LANSSTNSGTRSARADFGRAGKFLWFREAKIEFFR